MASCPGNNIRTTKSTPLGLPTTESENTGLKKHGRSAKNLDAEAKGIRSKMLKMSMGGEWERCISFQFIRWSWGSWECCKLLQQGLGQSPSQNWIWYNLNTKEAIWWHTIHWILCHNNSIVVVQLWRWLWVKEAVQVWVWHVKARCMARWKKIGHTIPTCAKQETGPVKRHWNDMMMNQSCNFCWNLKFGINTKFTKCGSQTTLRNDTKKKKKIPGNYITTKTEILRKYMLSYGDEESCDHAIMWQWHMLILVIYWIVM